MTKIVSSQYHEVAEMYCAGKTQAAVASTFGVSACLVSKILRSVGVNCRAVQSERAIAPGSPGGYKRIAPIGSHDVMVQMYERGETLAEIGQAYGITRERVRQILAKRGITKLNGGAAMRSFMNVSDKVATKRLSAEKTEARIRATWGMSVADYRSHVAQYGSTTNSQSPMHKFMQQRKNANLRGIEWDFTFPDWWQVWTESGKWAERGRGDGYVMARFGDGDVSYCKENVYICTASQNAKDSFIVSPYAVRFANCAWMNRSGTGRGWTYQADCTRNPYTAQFAGRNIGSFPTAELARAAYLDAVNGVFTPRVYRTTQGESHGKAKITEVDVIAIRSDSRKLREIADEYGLTRGTISQIRNRKRWRHVV